MSLGRAAEVYTGVESFPTTASHRGRQQMETTPPDMPPAFRRAEEPGARFDS
jgi:hypothetical protein